ncbi:aminotransferase class V-fold PLP-dependent enzyme [Sphingomonas sp. HDW15A]|uniref:kynureninase n=1 Tax=Sphingomonas sp. HDW15A TaxID=2714942 RepID=UPI001408FB9F|nr:aminotransferase class V-fold PLP-dependent enzyme [Sphingomonas sp. HDW15A]QIK97113.1 aminotransferase class V-fold PLP-dependent enzyme [Sphingomonas sp. HDW15A]
MLDPAELDAADPLTFAKARFQLPDGVIYLDGNSLGALPSSTTDRLRLTSEREWGENLIASWITAGWIDWPRQIAERIAPLVGASPDELLVCDSTSINLFKLAMAACALRPERKIILSEAGNFPTDLYMLQSVADLAGLTLRAVPRAELRSALDETVALVALTQVDYRSGERHDMAGLNSAAHGAGALTLWDLSHGAGVLAVDLSRSGADFAVGCGYKYLNGGPGAPAFLFVRRDLQGCCANPLPGWFGHSSPFDFDANYRPAAGIGRFQTGTPSILAMAALDEGLKSFDGVAIADVEAKAGRLGDLFIESVGDCLSLASPMDASIRGGHVVFGHDHAYAIVQAAIERGVIGDFRAPNLARFGFAPLYLSYSDVARAGAIVRDVVLSGVWREARFAERKAVT